MTSGFILLSGNDYNLSYPWCWGPEAKSLAVIKIRDRVRVPRATKLTALGIVRLQTACHGVRSTAAILVLSQLSTLNHPCYWRPQFKDQVAIRATIRVLTAINQHLQGH